MKQHDQTINIYLQTSSVTVKPGKIPGIPQKKIQHCTVGMLGRVLEIIMSTAMSPTLYPISKEDLLPEEKAPLGKGQELTPEKDPCLLERNLSSPGSNCQ